MHFRHEAQLAMCRCHGQAASAKITAHSCIGHSSEGRCVLSPLNCPSLSRAVIKPHRCETCTSEWDFGAGSTFQDGGTAISECRLDVIWPDSNRDELVDSQPVGCCGGATRALNAAHNCSSNWNVHADFRWKDGPEDLEGGAVAVAPRVSLCQGESSRTYRPHVRVALPRT